MEVLAALAWAPVSHQHNNGWWAALTMIVLIRGSPSESCYNWFVDTGNGWAEENSCGEYVGGDCVQMCMDQMDNLVNECYQDNCQ
jgi:hypothetical protein